MSRAKQRVPADPPRSRQTRGPAARVLRNGRAPALTLVGIFDWHVDEDRLVADAGLSRLFGMDGDIALRGGVENILNAIHPDDVAGVRNLIAEACETRSDYTAVFRVRLPDKSWRPVTALGRCNLDAGGELHFSGVVMMSAEIEIRGSGGRVTTSLPPREMQCLIWCSHGKTTWEIGRILGISDRTVEHHIASALRRLGCTTRVQGVALALRLGLIS